EPDAHDRGDIGGAMGGRPGRAPRHDLERCVRLCARARCECRCRGQHHRQERGCETRAHGGTPGQAGSFCTNLASLDFCRFAVSRLMTPFAAVRSRMAPVDLSEVSPAARVVAPRTDLIAVRMRVVAATFRWRA